MDLCKLRCYFCGHVCTKNKVTKIAENFIYFKTPLSCEQTSVIKKKTFFNMILKFEVEDIMLKNLTYGTV